MTEVQCKCKLCGLELNLRADEECERRWLDVFISMVCCNRCFDMREQRNEVTRKIYELCRFLVALNTMAAIKAEDKKRKASKVRDRLEIRTKEYADWFRRAINGRTIVWSNDFVDLLMDSPDRADAILKQYRQGARAEVLGQKEMEAMV